MFARGDQVAACVEVVVERGMNGVAVLVEPIKTHFLWRPILRDPNDEMVLEVAVNGDADAIVTFNLRDYREVPMSFGLEIITPSIAISPLSARS